MRLHAVLFVNLFINLLYSPFEANNKLLIGVDVEISWKKREKNLKNKFKGSFLGYKCNKPIIAYKYINNYPNRHLLPFVLFFIPECVFCAI